MKNDTRPQGNEPESDSEDYSLSWDGYLAKKETDITKAYMRMTHDDPDGSLKSFFRFAHWFDWRRSVRRYSPMQPQEFVDNYYVQVRSTHQVQKVSEYIGLIPGLKSSRFAIIGIWTKDFYDVMLEAAAAWLGCMGKEIKVWTRYYMTMKYKGLTKTLAEHMDGEVPYTREYGEVTIPIPREVMGRSTDNDVGVKETDDEDRKPAAKQAPIVVGKETPESGQSKDIDMREITIDDRKPSTKRA
jgi:hypothetical protein